MLIRLKSNHDIQRGRGLPGQRVELSASEGAFFREVLRPQPRREAVGQRSHPVQIHSPGNVSCHPIIINNIVCMQSIHSRFSIFWALNNYIMLHRTGIREFYKVQRLLGRIWVIPTPVVPIYEVTRQDSRREFRFCVKISVQVATSDFGCDFQSCLQIGFVFYVQLRLRFSILLANFGFGCYFRFRLRVPILFANFGFRCYFRFFFNDFQIGLRIPIPVAIPDSGSEFRFWLLRSIRLRFLIRLL